MKPLTRKQMSEELSRRLDKTTRTPAEIEKLMVVIRNSKYNIQEVLLQLFNPNGTEQAAKEAVEAGYSTPLKDMLHPDYCPICKKKVKPFTLYDDLKICRCGYNLEIITKKELKKHIK